MADHFDPARVPIVRAVRDLAAMVAAGHPAAGDAVSAFFDRQRAIAAALGPRAVDAHSAALERWLRMSIAREKLAARRAQGEATDA